MRDHFPDEILSTGTETSLDQYSKLDLYSIHLSSHLNSKQTIRHETMMEHKEGERVQWFGVRVREQR